MLKKIICAAAAVLLLMSLMACKQESDAPYVEYRGQKITMGAQAEEIITALGECQSEDYIGDCGGLGAQIKYSYPSVYVYVLESKDEGKIIDEISFRDDGITTPEGVYIGMSVNEAKQKLGVPTVESDAKLEYEVGEYVILLTVSDGKINKIDYKNI